MPESLAALILLGLALLFGAATIGATFVLGPKRPTPEKLAPYECGIQEIEAPQRALPGQISRHGHALHHLRCRGGLSHPAGDSDAPAKVLGLIELLVFAVILIVPFFYVWRKGAFTWE